MNLSKCFAAGLAAFLFLPTVASAQDNDDKTPLAKDKHHSQPLRYEFEIEPGNNMIFRQPVSFTGEVISSSSYDATIRAANGMTIRVPRQALLWNGNTKWFNQATEIGDKVVVHMRAEESYRIMNQPSVKQPMLAVGSYDGVYYLSQEFIADLDLENLDNNIYAEYRSEDKVRMYDVDLTSVQND
jgi:hypothetical protein